MASVKDFNKSQVVFGVILGISIIISAFLISNALVKIKNSQQRFSVKGYAEQPVTSDYAILDGSFSRTSLDLKEAFKQLHEDREKIKNFLLRNGITEKQITFRPPSFYALYKTVSGAGGYYEKTNEVESYKATQEFQCESDDVSLISKLSQLVFDLTEEGVIAQMNAPKYLITHLDQFKLDIIGTATQNAQKRAEQFAAHTGKKVGSIVNASQGIFQITQPMSTSTADYGIYDTSTIEKVMKIVVRVEFAIED